MKTFTVTTHGHRLEISASYWNGKEKIVCDGQVVSEKRSFLFLTPHLFTIAEAGVHVVYEVNVLTGMAGIGYVVRRNGIAVAAS
jgi:hypothetical protein